MSKLVLRFILISLLSFSLFACASTGTKTLFTSAKDTSRPNYSSIYYYVVASYFRAQDNFPVADMLLQKALESDPGSFQVKKQLLLNALNLHQIGKLTNSEVSKLIDSYSAGIEFDADILSANYAFYEQVADTTGMRKAIYDLQDRFPSARAYIQRFIFELRYGDNVDIAYLDTARLLAQNDPQSLLILYNIYGYYDRDKAKEALLRFHSIAPTDESHSLMAGIIVENSDFVLAKDYISGLVYPADQSYFQGLADEAMRASRYDILISLADELLNTEDLDLINALGFSALLEKRPVIIERIAALLPTLVAPESDKQATNALLIAHSINAGFIHPLDDMIAKLTESQYFDDIFAYYNYAVSADASAGWMDSASEGYARFSSQVELRLQDAAPERYLQSIVKAVQDSTSRTFVDAKFDLIQYLKQRHAISAKDYEYLLQYYHSKGTPQLRRSFLEEAVELYPQNPMFNNDLGYSMLSEGTDPEAAVILIYRALESEPDNPFYLDSLAWYYYLTTQYDRALELTASIKPMEDMPAEIAWHLGEIYIKANDFASARIYLEKCIASGDDPDYSSKAERSLKLLP